MVYEEKQESRTRTLRMMKTLIIACILSFGFCSVTLGAGHKHPEKFYQAQWCAEHKGQQEVTFKNGARADCVTSEYAVEFDFAPKWAEAVGQCLLYSESTKKQPAIVLITKGSESVKYIKRLEAVIKYNNLPIKVFYMQE